MNPTDLALLTAVVEATQQNSFVFTTVNDRANLIDAGFVEVNTEMPDPIDASKHATRATPAGVTYLTPDIESPIAQERFQVEDGVPMPMSKRAPKTQKYPIDTLEIGQCFHVAPLGDEDLEKLSKRMASVVSNANSRHRASKNPQEYQVVTRSTKNKDTGEKTKKQVKVEITIPLRRFTARRVDSVDPKGAGIRIFRVALPVKEVAKGSVALPQAEVQPLPPQPVPQPAA